MTDRFTIIGLGEILWDLFGDQKVLGGAPANFAFHVNGLGHRGVPLSRAGEDRLGDEIVTALEALDVPADYVQRDPDHPTGTVIVRLDQHGGHGFTIVEDVAWDYMEAERRWLELAARADAVCFGTLAQRCETSRAAIQQVLAEAGGALTVLDINFRQQFYSHQVITESLALARVLKLNEQEATALAGVLWPGAGLEADALMRRLIDDYGLELTCITRGERGCTLIAADGAVSRPVPPTEVVDTVGSGDAFTAGLAVKYLEGASLAAVAEAANLLGAWVAGHRGATPRLSPDVVERFEAL